jgi:hypothetical protein
MGSGTASVTLRTGIGVNERQYGVESSTGYFISMRFHDNLTGKREKLTKKTASVLVSLMKKGFYATYTQMITDSIYYKVSKFIKI